VVSEGRLIIVIRQIEHEVSADALASGSLPLMMHLATPYRPAPIPGASGIANEHGPLTMFWTHGGSTSPDERSDAHGDYAPNQ
jgi:hypothetical protein